MHVCVYSEAVVVNEIKEDDETVVTWKCKICGQEWKRVKEFTYGM